MNDVELSFIICTYNRDMYLHKAMTCVADQNVSKEKFELIVVDNCSTDNTEEICKQFAKEFPYINYSYFREEQQGLSFARNRGFKESNGDLLIYLDDDAFVESNYSEELIHFYSKHPQVKCNGGKTIPQFESGKPKWMSRFLLPLVAAVDLGNDAKPMRFNQFPIGANMVIAKSVMKEIGLFDVQLGRKGKNLQGGEEKDMFNRIREKGYTPWYVGTTVARHIIPDSRLTMDYIKKQARGIGWSEAIRVKQLGGLASLTKYVGEIAKWMVSVFLYLYYLVTFQVAKATMILRFRAWVSEGLFFGKE